MASVTILIQGEPAIQAKLQRRQSPQLGLTLRKATSAAAFAARPFIAAQAPVRTGKTKRSVSVRGLRRGTGATVGPRTWYRHFVIGGTSRGVEANPWVERGIKAGGEQAAKRALEGVTIADVRKS